MDQYTQPFFISGVLSFTLYAALFIRFPGRFIRVTSLINAILTSTFAITASVWYAYTRDINDYTCDSWPSYSMNIYSVVCGSFIAYLVADVVMSPIVDKPKSLDITIHHIIFIGFTGYLWYIRNYCLPGAWLFLYELSTIPLAIYQMIDIDKYPVEFYRTQVAFAITFFLCRVVWGIWIFTYLVTRNFAYAPGPNPLGRKIIFGAVGVSLILNFMWMGMIVMKALYPESSKSKKANKKKVR